MIGPAGAIAIGVAALVSAYGYLSANLLHAPRITFALAEQGDFPSILASVHPKYRTPHISILVYALLVFIFAALGTFQWNAVLSAVSRLAVYGAMAIAVPLLRRQRPGQALFRLPAPNLFAALALLFSALLLTQMGRGGVCCSGHDVRDSPDQLDGSQKDQSMTKTRTGEPFMPADDYGRAMPQFSVNLLVRNVENSVQFYRDVVGVIVRYADHDFAALELIGWGFMLHADHTYDHHPSYPRLQNSGQRGTGAELRFLGVDPDAIAVRAKKAGITILKPPTDYPHGWRELVLVDPDGYIWALGARLPANDK